MTGQHHHHDSDSLRSNLELARRRLAAVAAAIAGTEDRVADTLERMALIYPRDASGLLARAAQARHYAVVERNLAASLSRHR